jgi:integrase
MKSIKKGFAAACVRAGIEDLRPYDLRHTFATRLVERGVHHFVISALLGDSTPVTGFGYALRITPGYAHATWDAMVAAVESLERPSSLKPSVFAARSVIGQPKADEAGKTG